MYILHKNNKYVADPSQFLGRISLTKNIKEAYVFTEYREAEWIARMVDMEVRRYGQKEKKAEPSTSKEI